MERINPSNVASPIGTYDHVVKIPCKSLIFVAGQIPIDKQGQMVGQDPSRQLNLETQLRKTYANIKSCLQAAGADFKNVVRMNTYVVASAMNEYRNLNVRKIKEEAMGGTYGAGTVVFVAGLMRPEALVEIEVVAALE
jgi:enamine deaminase RidA (YjgF/YER057c/UK114 family)